MNPRPPSARLRELVDRRLAGTISRVELAELETLLLTPEGLDYYLHCAEIEAGLTLIARREEATATAMIHRRRPTPVAAPHPGRTLLLAAAAALVLLLAGAALLSLGGRPADTGLAATPDSTSPVAARVLRHIGVPQWRDERPDAVVRAGQAMEIDSGLVELESLTLASVIVEGPARLRFDGPDGLQLDYGRAVVRTVGAESPFHLDDGNYRLSGFRGEFAVDRDPDRGTTTVGVLEGRTNVEGETLPHRLVLERRQALELSPTTAPRSIAADLDGFHRRFPSRDFAWTAPRESFEPTWIEEDLSGLVWGPGSYLARFKWMHGADALLVERCELRVDDETVALDIHDAMVGDPQHTRDSSFRLNVAPEDYRRGRWTLRSLVRINPREHGQVQIPYAELPLPGSVQLADRPRLDAIRREVLLARPAAPDSNGLLLVESGSPASREDVIGSWDYLHDGQGYRRTFLADGSARFFVDGEPKPNFDRARWTFEDGILVLTIRNWQTGQLECVERHLVRNDGTLVFLDQPYRDAVKVNGEAP